MIFSCDLEKWKYAYLKIHAVHVISKLAMENHNSNFINTLQINAQQVKENFSLANMVEYQTQPKN